MTSADRSEAFPEAAIARESIRLFFRAIATEQFFVMFSTVGAVAVGVIAWRFGASDPSRILVWCALVGATEIALNALDTRFVRRPPPETHYIAWAWAKSGFTAAHGFAWGLGPILLHKAGDPISIVAPAWAIIIFTAALVYSCASFLPCIVLTIVTTIAPAAIWLTLAGSTLDRVIAVCLAASVPFTSVVGLFAARNMRSAIIGRLEIASLLSRAQDAQRERALFYSCASHDLRQPVHALGFYTSLLPAVSDAEEPREIERRVGECAKSLDRQFNAILGVADADRDVERATPRILAIQTILDAITTAILPEASSKNLRVRVVPSSLVVRADQDLLERVARNLAINAVRYTRHGSVLIGVRRKGPLVRFCILDTGIGIAEQDQDRIFDDFYQVTNPERSRDKGFGLGLSIVRRLCVAMDWGLELSSAQGRGSQFIVSLPAAGGGPHETAPPQAAEDCSMLPDTLVVLVVDDDPLVRDATSRMLDKWGVRATMAANGAEAIAALAERRPGEDWHALLDCRLAEGEDGFFLAGHLRATCEEPLRTTMMSGEIDDVLIERCRLMNIPVLRKPVKPIGLRALLSSPDAADRSREGGGDSRSG